MVLNTQLLLKIWVREIGIKSFGLGYKLVDLSDESTANTHRNYMNNRRNENV